MTGELSPADPGRQPAAPADMRASHEDRDRVADVLRVAAGDGRLSADELDERLEKALTARTVGELVPLTADLPAVAGAAMPVTAGPAPEAKELVRIQCGSGHVKRDGRWVVPQRMQISVTSGSVELNFTEAVVTGRVLQVDADVRSGHLRMVTRPGVIVDADEVNIRSGHVRTPTPWAADVPEVLRVVVTGRVRSGHINARPPRRNFFQWLRRDPRPYAAQLASPASRRAITS
ncbi:MAG TPA: DUF1707 domain-containing protein [Streptosporangiaceae bacterium]|jgi:hypothetical protein